MLFSSLFVPGFVVQSVLGNRLHVNLSREERIACSFGISLFLIASISFVTTLTGTGLREIFHAYFVASPILLAITIVSHRDWLVHLLSSFRKKPPISKSTLLIFSLVFLAIPLFHFVGFAKLNWDGFNFYLRDGLAMTVANSVSAYYPQTFYEGNIPLIFNSYLSSITYAYGISILNIGDFGGDAPQLMGYTNSALSFLVLATLFATCLLLRSFAHNVFKDKYLAAASVIIFLTTPLLNQFLYVWSLYADLFFAFETLLVIAFAYKFLKDERKNSRYFSLLMIGIGLSLAVVTKTYGYLLLLVIPLLYLKGIRGSSMSVEESPPVYVEPEHVKERRPAYSDEMNDTPHVTRNASRSNGNVSTKILVFLLFAMIIGFSSLYVIRSIMLSGSPFGYTVETLVNYSADESWANNVLNESGILESVENYPPQNQRTSLLLSYGLFPMLAIPLIIGIALGIGKDPKGVGLMVIYVMCFYVMFVTILGLRVDRHLFSLIALLPIIYAFGLKTIASYLRWKSKGVLYMALILILLQIPLFDAIYTDFKIAGIFPSMYYWYTDDNIAGILAYSLVSFGVAIAITHGIVILGARRKIESFVYAATFGTMLVVIVGSATTSVLTNGVSHSDYIRDSYASQHLEYPMALQELATITGDDSEGRLLYLHGMGTEYLTEASESYVKIDDFRMLADMRDVIEEKDVQKVHELLLSKDIKYILYPSENNGHYYKVLALASVTDQALLFSNPTVITSERIQLNNWWDLYVV
jgi:hypothetical protein